MFNFGTPEDTAKLFWENALSVSGPEIPEVHPSEMSEEDLMSTVAYARIAAERAMKENASPEVVDILVQQYDEIFSLCVNNIESVRENFLEGRHVYLGGYSLSNINKYREIADLPPLAN